MLRLPQVCLSAAYKLPLHKIKRRGAPDCTVLPHTYSCRYHTAVPPRPLGGLVLVEILRTCGFDLNAFVATAIVNLACFFVAPCLTALNSTRPAHSQLMMIHAPIGFGHYHIMLLCIHTYDHCNAREWMFALASFGKISLTALFHTC